MITDDTNVANLINMAQLDLSMRLHVLMGQFEGDEKIMD